MFINLNLNQLITGFTLDVDECSNGMNDCHRTTATCTNTRGSFICTCNSGYSGNGRQCIGMLDIEAFMKHNIFKGDIFWVFCLE